MNNESQCTMRITDIDVKDIRFPTAQRSYGSDVMHSDPNYSSAYVIISTNTGYKGYGMTFTLGRGTEIVVCAIKSLIPLIINVNVQDIFQNFSTYWRELTSESQLRWMGPEKGVIHLATAALVNALWDLWARIENKPVWKLLIDMKPEELVSTIDFRYLTDIITAEEAIQILYQNQDGKEKREEIMKIEGYPAYTTQVGWIGYSAEKVVQLCKKYVELGFTGFKIKVGGNLSEDKVRCRMVRDIIGPNNYLMIDSNQAWNVTDAINWVTELSEFKLHWIEEPTSPDDILGHVTISRALNPIGIKVASGEMCSNRVLFKQFLQSGAIQICQIDSCRLGSINEILSVYLMAKKLNVPVCPHAGGVGLCEMVQHLQMFDYISLGSDIQPGQFIEYVDEEHEHFTTKILVRNGKYIAPMDPGYGVRFKQDVFSKFEFPHGTVWKS